MAAGRDETADYVVIQRALDELGVEAAVTAESLPDRAAAPCINITVAGGITAGWGEFFVQLARGLADDTLRAIFDRTRVIVTDGLTWAEVGPEVPTEAIAALAEPPDAPSGQIAWDRDGRRWRDLLE